MRGRKVKDCYQPDQHKPLNSMLEPEPDYICWWCEKISKCFPMRKRT